MRRRSVWPLSCLDWPSVMSADLTACRARSRSRLLRYRYPDLRPEQTPTQTVEVPVPRAILPSFHSFPRLGEFANALWRELTPEDRRPAQFAVVRDPTCGAPS